MILGQAKSAVARLTPEEQADIRFVAVTLDPEHDDQAKMLNMAEGQGVKAPFYNLCVGEPEIINPLLNRMGIERHRDKETGVIEHTNLYLVIDRSGKIAYRFSLGTVQEDWLVEALHITCAEPEPSP
ncbi:MAG: SCO family protein [Planctomycetes bacterium]|nr:SCO family protein [Planctomycetota bacterium]